MDVDDDGREIIIEDTNSDNMIDDDGKIINRRY